MTQYRLVAEPAADLDIIAAFEWYEAERSGLGVEFLEELRAAYGRIVEGPFRYQDLVRHTPGAAQALSVLRLLCRRG